MRLTMQQDGDDLFVQGEWTSVFSGNHSRRLTEDLPDEVRVAAQQVIDWANEVEPEYRRAFNAGETSANLRRDIVILENLEREARAAGR